MAILMIPGPVNLDDAVMKAYGMPLAPHYGPSYVNSYRETVAYLKEILETDGDAYIMTGSGTIALESAISSLMGVGEKVIVGVNGFFGDRLSQFVRAYGGKAIEIKTEWGKALSIDSFENAIHEHPDAALIAVVHFETSTGVANPVREIAAAIKKSKIPILVDAVSSIGGLPYHMDDWGIDVTVTAPQKCLGAPPGICIIALSPSLWPRIEKRSDQPHGWYVNLNTWRWYEKNWGEWHPGPTTMPVNNVLALHEALRQLLEEGLSSRIARFQKLADHLRMGLKSLGMPLVVPPDIASPVMTVAWGKPEGAPTSELVRFLEAKYEIKIAGGLGDFKDKVIRIGHMSPLLTTDAIDTLLYGINDFIDSRQKGLAE